MLHVHHYVESRNFPDLNSQVLSHQRLFLLQAIKYKFLVMDTFDISEYEHYEVSSHFLSFCVCTLGINRLAYLSYSTYFLESGEWGLELDCSWYVNGFL